MCLRVHACMWRCIWRNARAREGVELYLHVPYTLERVSLSLNWSSLLLRLVGQQTSLSNTPATALRGVKSYRSECHHVWLFKWVLEFRT